MIAIAKSRGLKTINIVRRTELVAELQAAGGDVVLVTGENTKDEALKAADGGRIGLGIDAVGGKSEGARLDSQCKYAVVARGQADAYLRMPTKKGYVEKIWDHAAGMLIAQEAGAIGGNPGIDPEDSDPDRFPHHGDPA